MLLNHEGVINTKRQSKEAIHKDKYANVQQPAHKRDNIPHFDNLVETVKASGEPESQ